MKTGISSASLYPQLPTEAAVATIAAMGCPIVEVFLQTPREYRLSYVRRLARICRQLGLNVHSVHAASSHFEPLLFYSYRRQVLDGYDTLNRVLQAAAELECTSYTFHGPLRVTDIEPGRLVDGLAQVCETAASWGVGLSLENVSWCVGWQPKLFKWLVRQQVPNLGFTFDNKQAVRSGFPAENFIAAMAPCLTNVHLSDVSEKGAGLLPGHGCADFDAIARLLRKVGYRGPGMLEVYGFRVAAASQLQRSWYLLQSVFDYS